MKILLPKNDDTETIQTALNLQGGNYNEPVTFHCYWQGSLNEKHLYSILSCYYFNVKNKQHKICLWLENNVPNKYNDEIKKYASIQYFSLRDERVQANLQKVDFYYSTALSFYSDVVRYLLLFNYGGVWFDLDCFFLRSFDPIFSNFTNDICVYRWEHQNYPNGAIYMSLKAKSVKMKNNIDFIIKRNRGWGFQEASLTFDLPLELLVLPTSWFDIEWVNSNIGNLKGTDLFFENTDKQYTFDNFFKGSFCYHWHNKWNKNTEANSIISQLVKIIIDDLSN